MKSNKTFIVYSGSHYFSVEAFKVNFRTVHSNFAGIKSLSSCQLQTMIRQKQVNLNAQ